MKDIRTKDFIFGDSWSVHCSSWLQVVSLLDWCIYCRKQIQSGAEEKILNEIGNDAKFIQGHNLQPQWYKILKVFFLLGLNVGCYVIFGGIKTLVFFGCFFGIGLVLHIIYRIKTKKIYPELVGLYD